jgi:predicted RNase H-like HicB family nuclease
MHSANDMKHETARVTLHVETELEDDGRWIAAIPELRGVMVYGDSQADAVKAVHVLALRVIADRLETGELPSTFEALSFAGAA